MVELMLEIIITVFIILIISIIMAFIQRDVEKPIQKNINNQYVLKLNKFYLYTGIFLCFVGVMISFLILIFSKDVGHSKYNYVGLTILISWLMGVPSLFLYRNHFILVNEIHIELSDFFGRKSIVKWEEIKAMSYNPKTGYLMVNDINGKKYRISKYLVGLSEFFMLVEKKTKWTAKELKMPTSGEVDIVF